MKTQALSRVHPRHLLQNLTRRHSLTKRDRGTLVLMVSILPVCCIHQMFGVGKVNGFLFFDYPLEAYWYVYFLSRSVAWVLVSLVLVRVTKNGLRCFSKLFLAYNIYGLVMYFINFNSVNYYYVPLIIIAIICNKVYN